MSNFTTFDTTMPVRCAICLKISNFSLGVLINCMLIKKDKVLIKKGTPLCMYIPIRREEFKMSQSDETPELEKIRKKSKLNMFSRFTDSYRQKQKEMMKSGDYKCPHHK